MPGLYTTLDDVRDLLPDDLPTEVDEAKITKWIQASAGEVDAGVGGGFNLQDNSEWKFGDTPSTPRIIQSIALWLAVSMGFAVLKEVSTTPEQLSDEDKYRQRAEEKLEQIRAGVLEVVSDSDSEATGITVVARDQIFKESFIGQKFYGTEDQYFDPSNARS